MIQDIIPGFTTINLRWNAAGAFGSLIEYSTDGGVSSLINPSSRILASSATSATLSNLNPNTPYFIRISKVSDIVGTIGGISTIGSVTTLAQATGEDISPEIQAIIPGITTINLRWDAAGTFGSLIEYSTDGGLSWLTNSSSRILASSTTTALLSDLSPNTQYSIRISKVLDTVGSIGGISTILSTTTLDQPTGDNIPPEIQDIIPGFTTINLRWNAAGAFGSLIEYSTDGGLSWLTNSSSRILASSTTRAVLSDLSPNTQYSIRISKVLDTVGSIGGISTILSTTTLDQPTGDNIPPEIQDIIPGFTTINLRWNAAGAFGSLIEYSTDGGLSWSTNLTSRIPASSAARAVLSDLSSNTPYSIRISKVSDIVGTIGGRSTSLSTSTLGQPTEESGPTPPEVSRNVISTNTSIIYAVPSVFGCTYSVSTTEVASGLSINSSNISIIERNGLLHITISNLLPNKVYTSSLICTSIGGSSTTINLPDAMTSRLSTKFTELEYDTAGQELPTSSLIENTLVRTTGLPENYLITPTKLDFLYNYYDYSVVTYPLVRLFGRWPYVSVTNALTVNVNGNTIDRGSWTMCNSEFKIFVKLFSQTNLQFGRPNGLNTIIISDGTNTKTVHFYYSKQTVTSTIPHIECILYDGSDGDGSCDGPPTILTNNLIGNTKRLQVNMLMLQSFFAESYKASREKQEGLSGLPYTTFVLNLDSNDDPVVTYVKSTYPRSYFWENNFRGNHLSDYAITLLWGDTARVNGGVIYFAGYSLISHYDHITGIYKSGFAEGGNGNGMMNGGNLIWQPTSIPEIQTCFNDNSPLPSLQQYNVIDAADSVAGSCARILGSLMHEITHSILDNEHPSQIAGVINDKPSSYVFSFDARVYNFGFGIEDNSATYIRNWFMPGIDNITLVDRVISELGQSDNLVPSCGWWSPYSIKGYTNVSYAVRHLNYDKFVTVQIISTQGSTNNVILDPSSQILYLNDPLVLCHHIPYPDGATFGGLTPGTVYYVNTIHKTDSTYIITLKASVSSQTPVTLTTETASPPIKAVKSSSGLYYWKDRIGWSNCNVLRPHPEETTLTIDSSTSEKSIALPSTSFSGYIVGQIWGAGGSSNFQSRIGGAGGSVNFTVPLKPNDSISFVNGSTNGVIGGGGLPNPRSGGPYAGAGGGRSILALNGLPVCIAGGGGGGGQYHPGRSVFQTTKYDETDGDDAVFSAGGGDNLLFDSNNFAGCGGGGYAGGSSGKYINNTFGGGAGGYGSGYINGQIPGFSLQNGGIPVLSNYLYLPSRLRGGLSTKRILPSIFSPLGTTYGNSLTNGGIVYKLIYVSPSSLSGYTSPSAVTGTLPPVISDDNPSVLTIIPRPFEFISSSDTDCIFNTSSVIINVVDTLNFGAHSQVFANEFKKLTNVTPMINSIANNPTLSENPASPQIYLLLDALLADTEFENYRYNIRITNGAVTISAATLIGMSHGTATFLQMIRASSPTIRIKVCEINDYAACKNTGIMIDLARDNFELPIMYQLIDYCRFYKMRYIHIHGNDESHLVAMAFYWNPAGNVAAGDPTTMPNDGMWYRSEANWNNLVEYARIRGVAFIPELEAYGRGNGLRVRFPNTFQTNVSLFNIVSDSCYSGLVSIIQQLAITFYTSPYIFIGNDESDDSFVLNIPGAQAFANTRNIPYNRPDIIKYYFISLYNAIANAGKQMICWENVNSTLTLTTGHTLSTNNNAVVQVWKINGGASGADGYIPAGLEDGTPYNIHSGTESYLASGIPVVQTPWKPRIYSPMKAMFDWGPANGLNTSVISTSDISVSCRNPIPKNSKLLGSETLLWEASGFHYIKYDLLRYKSPIRAENTYGAWRSSTSLTNAFAPAFEYLDKRIDTISNGVRLIESGLSQSMSKKMITNTDTIIPFSEFDDTLILTFIKNDPSLKIYYTLSSDLRVYPITAATPGSSMFDSKSINTNVAVEYTQPIIISKYSQMFNNGFIAFKAQVFNSSNVAVGILIDRRYVCVPFTMKVAGGMRNTNLEGTSGKESNVTLYFNNNITITAENVPNAGVIRYSVGSALNVNSPALSNNQQLQITGSSDPVSVGCFLNNLPCGKIFSYSIKSTNDSSVSNSYVVSAKPSFNITYSYTSSSSITLASLLSSVTNCPGAIKVSCTVVGGGGNGSNQNNGFGAGGGGIATEVYNDVSTLYTLVIEVGSGGNQSSVSFTPICLIGASGVGSRSFPEVGSSYINNNQDPIYPTVAYGGTNGTSTNPGLRGVITKGDVITRANASGTTGGAGYTYSGIEYGKGGNAGPVNNNGSQGIVIINLQPI